MIHQDGFFISSFLLVGNCLLWNKPWSKLVNIFLLNMQDAFERQFLYDYLNAKIVFIHPNFFVIEDVPGTAHK